MSTPAFEQEVRPQTPRYVACTLEQIQEPIITENGSIGQSFKFSTVAAKPSSFFHSVYYTPEQFEPKFKLASLQEEKDRDSYTRNFAGISANPEKDPFCGSFFQVLFGTPENLAAFLEEVRSQEITATSVFEALTNAQVENRLNPQFGATLHQKVEPILDDDGNIAVVNGKQQWIPKKGWKVRAKTYRDDQNKYKRSGFFWLTPQALEKVEKQTQPTQYGDVYAVTFINEDMLP